MNDLISRQAAIDALINFFGLSIEEEYGSVIQEVLNNLPSAHRATGEWCTDCKEYDQERHCCPRFNRVIRDTLKDAQPDMLEDGTLIVTVPKGTEVGRVLVQEEGTHNGALFYRDAQPEAVDVARAMTTIIENEKDMRVIKRNAEPRWIPVTERLPEDVELGVKYPTVIFCTEDATYTGYYEYHIGGLWLDEGGDNIIHGVIAWMPLPEPWKGEDDAEVH